jgi:hypothetical protein
VTGGTPQSPPNHSSPGHFSHTRTTVTRLTGGSRSTTRQAARENANRRWTLAKVRKKSKRYILRYI